MLNSQIWAHHRSAFISAERRANAKPLTIAQLREPSIAKPGFGRTKLDGI